MNGRRVVVTGMGLICPLGNDLGSSWKACIAGRPGISRITLFDASAFSSQIAGEVRDFDPTSIVPKNELKRYDRFSLFALEAADEAWKSAGLEGHGYLPPRMGCILGIGIGGIGMLEQNHRALLEGGPRKVSPFVIPAMISNLGPGNIGIRYNLQGINFTISSACTSGTHAIGEAWRMIRSGLQDVIVTGGAEAAITPLSLAGFGRMRALSTRNEDPTHASRPFDRDRDGFVIGEGAGVLILEELEAAKRRGAPIHAEVVGYGYSCDAFHITAPPEGGAGAVFCMRGALEAAGLRPDQVPYINAHGTSTPINDAAETTAIKQVFGPFATAGLMVSSTKSMTGHLLGGAGGVEAVFSVMAVKTSMVPPTINLESPDPACDLDYVPHVAREASIETAMSNSFGFGGTNASLIVKRYQG